MNFLLYFYSETLLDLLSLQNFIAHHFRCNKFILISDLSEFIISGATVDESAIYIALDIEEEGFKYNYTIFSYEISETTLVQQVTLLKLLAVTLQVDIMSTDDEISSYSWILIESSGQTSTVSTSSTENKVVLGYRNFSFGAFVTREVLSETDKLILQDMVKPVFPQMELWFGNAGPVLNGAFDKIKSHHTHLTGYNFHCDILPIGKNPWYDKTEKSKLFITVMKNFQTYYKEEICLFPPDFMKVKNIPGGTDSDEYCILLKDGKEHKITYKEARPSL